MEKRLSVSVKKIVGQPNPKEGKWSDCLVFEPEDEHRIKTRGRLFAVLDLTGSTALDLAHFGRLSLETLREEYYASEETSPLKALEEAIHKAQHRLVELVFGPKGAVADSALNYNFAAAALWGTILYLAKFGASGLYLYRGKVIEELGEAKDEKVFSASGMVRDDDVVILGSSDFRHTFSVGELPESLDKLESLVADLGNPPGVSVLVLRLKLASVPGKEEVLEIAPVVRRESRFEKLISSLSEKIRTLVPLGQKPPEIYVEREGEERIRPRKRRIPKAALLVLVSLFLAASAFTIKRRQKIFRASEATKLISGAEQTISDARQYVDLNNSRARELLLQAQSDLQAVGELGIELAVVEEELAEIRSLLDEVNKVKRLKDLEIFYDLTIQSPSASPTSIAGDGESLFVTDPASEVVYQISSASGGPPEVENAAGQKVLGARVIRIVDDRLFISGVEGVSQLDLRTLELGVDLVAGDFVIEDIKDLGIYFGNVYLLIPSQNQILRAVVVEGGEYSTAKYWVTTENPPLADAVSMTIDGFIYVLKSSGEVLKFEKGELVLDSRLKELDQPFSDPRAIFTTTDSEYLYILDAGNKRIVVTDKDGLYQSQYLCEGEGAFADPKGLFVDEVGGVIYLLDGTKIYKIAL